MQKLGLTYISTLDEKVLRWNRESMGPVQDLKMNRDIESPSGVFRRRGCVLCEQDCKPGSVFGSHLSRRTVAGPLQPPPEDGRASHMSSHGVAPDRVYSIGQSPADG